MRLRAYEHHLIKKKKTKREQIVSRELKNSPYTNYYPFDLQNVY